MIDGLQKTVADLSAVNARLHNTADDLQAQLKHIRQDNESLRRQCLEIRNQKKGEIAHPRQESFFLEAPASSAAVPPPQQTHIYKPVALPTTTPPQFSFQRPATSNTSTKMNPPMRSAEDATLHLILDLLKSRTG